jgi:outer membrane protein assembly factor BamB
VLSAFDAGTGAKRWSVPFGSMYGMPALANGSLYVAPHDDGIYTIRASDGQQVWSFHRPSAVGGYPMVAGGVLYVADDSATVYALDAATGHPRWHQHETAGFDGVPVVATGVVYVGANDNTVYAFRVDGTLLWRVSLGSVIISRPAVGAGLVYVGVTDATVDALDAGTGSKKWSFATDVNAGQTGRGALLTGTAPLRS